MGKLAAERLPFGDLRPHPDSASPGRIQSSWERALPRQTPPRASVEGGAKSKLFRLVAKVSEGTHSAFTNQHWLCCVSPGCLGFSLSLAESRMQPESPHLSFAEFF